MGSSWDGDVLRLLITIRNEARQLDGILKRGERILRRLWTLSGDLQGVPADGGATCSYLDRIALAIRHASDVSLSSLPKIRKALLATTPRVRPAHSWGDGLRCCQTGRTPLVRVIHT